MWGMGKYACISGCCAGNSGCCVAEMLVSVDVVWCMLVSLDEAWRNKCISGCCVGKMLVSVDVVGM